MFRRLPADYLLKSMHGLVHGTLVNATCVDRTPAYAQERIPLEIGGIDSITRVVRRPGRVGSGASDPGEIIVISMWQTGLPETESSTLSITSNVTHVEDERGNPVHVIAIAGHRVATSASIFECTYAGNEVLIEVTKDGRDGPFVAGRVVKEDVPIDKPLKELIARNIHYQIARGGNGGALAEGLVDANYIMSDSRPETITADLLSVTLSQTAQHFISTLREQHWVHSEPGEGAFIENQIAVHKMGAGSDGFGWLAVYGLLLLLSLAGLIKVSVGGEAVEFDAQDAPALLGQVVRHCDLSAKTQIQFLPGVGLVHIRKPNTEAEVYT